MKRANPLAFAMTPASTDEPGSPRSTNRQLPQVAGDIVRCSKATAHRRKPARRVRDSVPRATDSPKMPRPDGHSGARYGIAAFHSALGAKCRRLSFS